MAALDGEEAFARVMEGANLVLTFQDESGEEWMAAAVMTPLKKGSEYVNVAQMPDRAFLLTNFKVVTR